MNQQLHGPGYAHQPIDDTSLSVLSTQSDKKPLRSALRQPFSSSKPSQSLRSVRFDFMGSEVLPTASPEATNFMAPSSVSPTPSAEHVSFGLILDDEEQALPRMGALSKKPLDPGMVWTVVNPAAMSTKTHRISRKSGTVSEGLEDGDDDRSGEKPPINVKPSIYTTSAKSSSSSEEENMFHFEAGSPSAPPRPQPKLLYVEEEEEGMGENLGNVPNIKLSLYTTSLAVDIITKPSPLSALATPTMARFEAGSLGSYKGQPIIMPVVRNPDVYARAASLGPFDTFVGGLGGRSGMDESSLNSFRGGVFNMPLSGMPRSFTERLMMEDGQIEEERVAMFSQVTACGP